MKFLIRLLLSVLVIIILAVIALCILLHSRWGTAQIQHLVNKNSDYAVSFDAIAPTWSFPPHVVLKNLTLRHTGEPISLRAKSVDIGLSVRQFSEPLHVSSLALRQGSLNLTQKKEAIPLQADQLIFQDMAINREGDKSSVTAEQVNGHIIPWQPGVNNFLGDNARIEFNAGSLKINGVSADNVQLQGSLDNHQIILSSIKANFAHGLLMGNASRNAEGTWQMGLLQLDNAHLQTAKTLSEFLAPVTLTPLLKIDQLDVTNTRFEGKAWAVNDLNLHVKELTLEKGIWQSEGGNLLINASEFIDGPIHFHDPILNIDLTPQGATLRQFSSRWKDGMIRATGQWFRAGNHAVMDEIVISGLEYTLPVNWSSLWMHTSPHWLSEMTVKKLSADRNLIIDINPDWPFQLTGLNGSANNLQLIKNHQWGIWSGVASFNAQAATFNRVDVNSPSISLNASPESIAITDLHATTEKGSLQATATLSQPPEQKITVNLNGQNVPVNILHAWGWPALPLNGDGNIQLSATGHLLAHSPLKPTVNGTLKITDSNGQHIQQTMHQGNVPGA